MSRSEDTAEETVTEMPREGLDAIWYIAAHAPGLTREALSRILCEADREAEGRWHGSLTEGSWDKTGWSPSAPEIEAAIDRLLEGGALRIEDRRIFVCGDEYDHVQSLDCPETEVLDDALMGSGARLVQGEVLYRRDQAPSYRRSPVGTLRHELYEPGEREDRAEVNCIQGGPVVVWTAEDCGKDSIPETPAARLSEGEVWRGPIPAGHRLMARAVEREAGHAG